jgi:hypothetical protein
MPTKTLLCLVVAACALATADVALADGNVSCPAATRAERKPPGELTAMLKKMGWSIRKMQMFNNCYEVYGFDDKGKPVEAFFDPRTLQRVAVQP